MRKLNNEDQLEIERLGGLVGMGLPGSRIRSRAILLVTELSIEEQHSVAALFNKHLVATPSTQNNADDFCYRLTLHHKNSNQQIDVKNTDLLESLQQQVHDELI
jgi:hypothetical protein